MIRRCEECKCQEIAGTWTYEDLKGAAVRIKSLPIANRFGFRYSDEPYEIDDIIFQVTQTGKTIVIVKLKGTDCLFTFKDLEVLRLDPHREFPVVEEDVITGTIVIDDPKDLNNNG